MWDLFLTQLRAQGTLKTAVFVGMLINLYGQVLVPWLRGGGGSVFGDLRRNFAEAPLLGFISIALGFVFPWLVSAYASARAHIEIGAAESLARFPDLKPDPVFRAEPGGTIIAAGAQTRILFEQHGIARAQDIIGPDLWRRIVVAVERDSVLLTPETLHFAPADRSYVVTASASPDGINVYLAVVPYGARRSGPPEAKRSA